MKVKLSTRLLMSATMVPKGTVVADIGCDHAHTCIWLLQNGRAEHCIGMDVRKGPLGKAAENLALYGCADRVELRLGYGLDELKPGEADTVVIAGMGGELTRDILERDLSSQRVTVTEPAPVLILQPHSHVWDVRSWLNEHGYIISDEDMCREDDKFYPVIKAVKTTSDSEKKVIEIPDKAEIYFGPVLLGKKHPVLKEFLDIEYRKKKYLLEQIDKSSTYEARTKRIEVEGIYNLICEARERYCI